MNTRLGRRQLTRDGLDEAYGKWPDANTCGAQGGASHSCGAQRCRSHRPPRRTLNGSSRNYCHSPFSIFRELLNSFDGKKKTLVEMPFQLLKAFVKSPELTEQFRYDQRVLWIVGVKKLQQSFKVCGLFRYEKKFSVLVASVNVIACPPCTKTHVPFLATLSSRTPRGVSPGIEHHEHQRRPVTLPLQGS